MPLRPLAEAVFSGFRGDGPPSDGDLGLYEPLLSRLCGLAPQDGAPLVGYAEAVLRLLHVLGRDGGCVLVLEDLHDADADTLAIVDYLTDNLSGQRAVLLATLRGEAGPALDLAEAATSRRTARTVRLARLGAAGTAELAARCLGHDTAEDVPAAVLDRLHTVSEGVPFVVEELLRAMVDGGGLVRDGGSRWTVAGSLDAGVPDTVAAAVLQRVDQLPPPGIALLEAAAVLGRRFPVDIAARAAGLDHATALTQLRHAAHAHLVSGATTPSDPGWHTFRHALTADAITRRLLPPERAALCLAAADAIEAARGASPAGASHEEAGREGGREASLRGEHRRGQPDTPGCTKHGRPRHADRPERPWHRARRPSRAPVAEPDASLAIAAPAVPGAALTLTPPAVPSDHHRPLGGDAGDDLYRLAAELCVTGGRPARAAVLLTRAGKQAVARGALLTAVELLDRGLELTARHAGRRRPRPWPGCWRNCSTR